MTQSHVCLLLLQCNGCQPPLASSPEVLVLNLTNVFQTFFRILGEFSETSLVEWKQVETLKLPFIESFICMLKSSTYLENLTYLCVLLNGTWGACWRVQWEGGCFCAQHMSCKLTRGFSGDRCLSCLWLCRTAWCLSRASGVSRSP